MRRDPAQWRRLRPNVWHMVGDQYRYWYYGDSKLLVRQNVLTGMAEECGCRSLPQGYSSQPLISAVAARFSLARTRGYLRRQA